MKKTFIILAVLIILPLASIAAQDTFTLVSFDIGYGPSVTLVGSQDFTIAQSFGLNVRVTGPLTVGVLYRTNNYYLTGGTPAWQTGNMLRLKFDLTPVVRFGFGYGTNNHIALGLEIVPFRRQLSGLFTEFKLVTDYVFTSSSLEEGALIFALTFGIGI